MRKLYWIVNCKIRFPDKRKRGQRKREGKVRTEREKVDSVMGTNSLKKKKIFFLILFEPVPIGPKLERKFY